MKLPLSQINPIAIDPSIALVVFTQSAEGEMRQKNLPGGKSGRKFIKSVQDRAIRAASGHGTTPFIFDESHQKGEELNERLANAVEQMFADGFRSVILIGSDVPNIQKKHVKQAFTAMRAGSAALGATYDGGDYIIGLHREHYNRAAFLYALEDKTAVHQNLSEIWSERGVTCEYLEQLCDLDDRQSLELWLETVERQAQDCHKLALIALNAETPSDFWIQHIDRFISEEIFRNTPLRAPPVISA